MTLHYAIVLGIFALGALVCGLVFGLCITAKRADEAMSEAIEDFKKENQL